MLQDEKKKFYPSLPPSEIKNKTTLLWECNCRTKLFSTITIVNNQKNKNNLWMLHSCPQTTESQLQFYNVPATPCNSKQKQIHKHSPQYPHHQQNWWEAQNGHIWVTGIIHPILAMQQHPLLCTHKKLYKDKVSM